MKKLVAVFLLGLAGIATLQLCSRQATVNVSAEIVGHNPDRISNLFGVHSLFWAVQDKLSDASGEMKPEAVARLQEAGVDLIRHGGGINEIDWSQCVGAVAARVPQKVMSWAAPVPCRFGISEYEHVNEQLGARYSWHMSNLVGFGFNTEPAQRMADTALAHAHAVKQLSSGRQVYWELGNELGDGVQKWTAVEIGDRAARIATVIHEVDPAAKFVVPLLTFRPLWVKNDLEFNKEVARRVKNHTSAFALHTYYDNPPEGPSVSNRLKRIAETSVQLRQQGFAAPELWITEHSRWPAGNPSLGKAWLENWYQAADFDGLLSTADFIIGLSQLDDVDGAMWHVLNGESWSFLLLDHGQPVLSPLAELFKFLQPRVHLDALKTVAYSSVDKRKLSNNAIRASALRDRDSGNTYIWIVNRSDQEMELPVTAPTFEKNSSIKVVVRTLQEGNYSELSNSRKPVVLEQVQTLRISSTGSANFKASARSVLNIAIAAD